MHETIKFLDVIDSRIKHESLHNSPKQTSSYLKKSKFPYARVLNFSQNKFNQFPKWLTERDDFLEFMYGKYEKKLLSIPKISQKQTKASDERYFISLYLQQIPMFKNLPTFVLDLILDPNQIIHHDGEQMNFMGIIFVGTVQYTQNNKKVTKIKNDVIFNQAFYDKKHSTTIAKQQTVLLTISKEIYPIIQKKIIQDIQQKSRDQIADLIKSDFFIELHLKDRKARQFFQQLKPEFYFVGEHICEAGEVPEKFFIHFRGQVTQKNHIYIRQHNKWPLPNRRWEVRAVYNSFENTGVMKQNSFFGDEEIINSLKTKSTYIAKSHSVLFSMNKDVFINSLTTEDFKRLKKYRNEHVNINYGQFERDVRDKVKSVHDKKKIVHKAIDTSFANRKEICSKKVNLVQRFEKQMLTHSIQQDLKNITVS